MRIFVEQGRHDQLLTAYGQADHGQVELTSDHLRLEGGVRSVGHVQADVRVLLAQPGEQLGNEPPARGADHAGAHRARDLLTQRDDVRRHGVELGHHPAGPGYHHLALFGQAPGRPVDQHDVELTLEAGDVGGDVGLDRADGVRRGRKAPALGNANERLQVFQVHRGRAPNLTRRTSLWISLNDQKYL